ncbi:MAG: Rne/Rng family ribonuclease [Alphaproteobacteria bacterium]|nr:Rne/Rng family ribonuclease [Alphaproteobacteria bacterium]
MSINKMLIDATHPEETRVVVLRENRVEEFDYESAARKLLRGSIYLAKITRVEPSLQAAFVDYGGNRHGFLAFSEIHPDYYQIPHADKVALLEQESRDQAAYDDELDDDDPVASADVTGDDEATAVAETVADDRDDQDRTEAESDEPDYEAHAIDVTHLIPDTVDAAAAAPGEAAARDSERNLDEPRTVALETTGASDEAIRSDVDEHVDFAPDSAAAADEATPSRDRHDGNEDDDDSDDDDDVVESLNDNLDDDDDDAIVALDDNGDEESDNVPVRRARSPRPRRRARSYKIQEVIKRRQIVLIQVVKEERGNKGAALTTYLSLAGRYTVLMPNTARGGGISRKITNVPDRKRLKAIAQELEVPEGMGLIIRTAGASRTKQEIKRDFEYLLRLWENVRSLTLESTAPSLVYEEGNLIKRSIRDLYTKEIDEVVVAGEYAHKEAKSFMRMLMPSHAKNVIKHEDSQSLFAKYRIEQQLNAMFSPNVQLKSGGYLVINQTEALVAIDVNSGKSTREFSIEETALNTNLEAAEEISRQLKLRDLAGLIVIDFIDMEEKRNNRAVERRLKDFLRADRARIQVGRISHFGLLEMSRQRLRTGVLEGSTMPCSHCQGSGIIRSTESVSLAVLRALEDTFVAGKMMSCAASTSAEVALYLLNQKRAFIQELEHRYGVLIHIRSSDKQQGANFVIEPLQDTGERARPIARDAVNIDAGFSEPVAANDDQSDDEIAESKPRRRRRRRGRRDDNREEGVVAAENGDDAEALELADTEDTSDDDREPVAEGDGGEDRPRRSRRRGRRGGRRHRDRNTEPADDVAKPGAEQPPFAMIDVSAATGEPVTAEAGESNGEQTDAQPTTSPCDVAEMEPTAAADAGQPDKTVEQQPSSVATGRIEDNSPAASDDRGKQSQSPEGEQDEAVSEPAQRIEASAAENEPPEPAEAAVPPVADDEPVTAEPVTAEPVAAEPAAAEPVIDKPMADEPVANDRSSRSRPVASEPVIQRVVVAPNGSTEAGTRESPDSETTAKPQRRGWWQRQFGG